MGAEDDEPLLACMRPQSMASLSTSDSPSSSSTEMRPSMASGGSDRTSTLSSVSTIAGADAPLLRRRWGNDMLGGQDHEAEVVSLVDGQHASWVSPTCAPLLSQCSPGDVTLPRPRTPCRRGASMTASGLVSLTVGVSTQFQQSPGSSFRPTVVTKPLCPEMLPQMPWRTIGTSEEDVIQAVPRSPRGLQPLDSEASQMSREAQPLLLGGNQPLRTGCNCAVDATFSLHAAPATNKAAPLLGGSLTRMSTHPQWPATNDARRLNGMTATDTVHRVAGRSIML